MYLVFDTETTGLPERYNAPWTDTDNWPRLVQLAWIEYDKNGNETFRYNQIIKPEGYSIPQGSIVVHGINNEKALNEGVPMADALSEFNKALGRVDYLIAHNIDFDLAIMGCELYRMSIETKLSKMFPIDTMKLTKKFCKIPGYKGSYKNPKLIELHQKLFGKGFDNAHDALVDVEACARCFFELQNIGYFDFHEPPGEVDIVDDTKEINVEISPEEEAKPLVHFSCHTHYSLLRGAGSITNYLQRAKELGHNSIAIIDRETMSGTFELWKKAKNYGIKGIFGAELYLNDTIGTNEFERGGYPVKLIIKNKQGYVNLNKLIYKGHTEGFDNMYSRIKTDWIIENKEGLIITTGNYEGYLANLYVKGKVKEAVKYWEKLQNAFGEDFIAEIKFSELNEQKRFNTFVLKNASSTGVKVILDNDVHYVKKEDVDLQDVVTSIKDGRKIDKANTFKRRHLYYLSRKDYYWLNQKFGYNYPKEVLSIFMDNTLELAEKCNFDFEVGIEKYPKYEPTHDIIKWAQTTDTKEIITKMAFGKLKQKLKRKFEKGQLPKTQEVADTYANRLKYELQVIEDKKMLDYFLVNWEILRDYRKNGYDTGSARGCFLPGSRVKMSDGMHALIDTISIGDTVLDAFGDARKVLDTLEYDIDEDIVELEFDDGRTIECTLDHEILTENRGWVQAKDLTEEDDIADINKE